MLANIQPHLLLIQVPVVRMNTDILKQILTGGNIFHATAGPEQGRKQQQPQRGEASENVYFCVQQNGRFSLQGFAGDKDCKNFRLMREGSVKNADIRLVRSLEHKKFRKETGLFVVEGDKMVREVLNSALRVRKVFAVEEWLEEHHPVFHNRADEFHLVSERELVQLSLQQSPHQALALVEIPECDNSPHVQADQLTLYLDNIQDPGNLGTIIRIADWFGIRNVVCSPGSADAFNPKVVQATMGGIARVRVMIVSPELFFEETAHKQIPVFGTFLNGANLYDQSLPEGAVIVMGNESRGISGATEALVTHRITIPSYPADLRGAESLNVAVAAAVVCAEFRRQATTRGPVAPAAYPGIP